ncbi:MAG: EAL domain-containing protein [Spirochaetales bacterium]|nr:EAL domain-containing protein [Spirochaetales bacterium]
MCKDKVIKIAPDDFGSGFSSFTLLRQIPLDILKIDRNYISNIPGNKRDATIAGSLIAIGHSMDLQVAAEGIENEERLAFLNAKNRDLAQGCYFSVPVPKNETTKLLGKPYPGG